MAVTIDLTGFIGAEITTKGDTEGVFIPIPFNAYKVPPKTRKGSTKVYAKVFMQKEPAEGKNFLPGLLSVQGREDTWLTPDMMPKPRVVLRIFGDDISKFKRNAKRNGEVMPEDFDRILGKKY